MGHISNITNYIRDVEQARDKFTRQLHTRLTRQEYLKHRTDPLLPCSPCLQDLLGHYSLILDLDELLRWSTSLPLLKDKKQAFSDSLPDSPSHQG